jgi:two-component system catabolic regulation response regulator CreB
MRMPPKVLIIEDEAAIADTLVYALKTDGFEPVWHTTGQDGRRRLAVGDIALIVLDIGLPDISGLEVCKQIRRESAVPIMFLTARAEEIDRVVGLEIGADDYLVKPFSPRELTARVKAILRRTARTEPAADNPPTVAAVFRIDTTRMAISYLGTPLELSRSEFNVLATLVKHPGRIFSRDELMNLAWENPEACLDRTVDAHIKNIRGKLRAVDPKRDPIETRRGFGYGLKEAP